MFKIKFADAKFWRNIIEALSSLVDEGNFIVKPEGISMKAMDPSHIAMVDFELPKDAFKQYECADEVKVGLNLDEMVKIMRRAGADDALELSVEPNSNRLNIKFIGKALRRFGLSLIDIQNEELPTPNIQFKTRVKLTTDALRQAIDDALIVSDHIKFIAEDENLILKATGDTGEVEIKLNAKEDGAILEFDKEEDSTATYALDYLSDIMKGGAASNIVEIKFSTNMPINVNFPLLDSGRITYYLAPRVEAE
ncbi:MAG: proliferating cell nuclear antigen (pcna) [Candidatus Odinarchaeia archaeon]